MRKAVKLGLLSALGIMLAAAAPAMAQAQPAAAGGGISTAQTCLKCHGNEPGVSPILKTPHAVSGDRHSPFGQDACQSCHGDSTAHVASRSNPPSVVFKGPNISPVPARNAACLTCHQSGMRMNWRGSQHANNETACTDCHQAHIAKDPVLVKATQPEKCFTCHAEQRADSFKYSHHPIREGKVVCSDCHNPHGSPGPKLLKEFTVNETCYNCHAEKRGPLLWEHQPVRENCLNCHTAHGSTQARLLIERPPFLCQECHAQGGHQIQDLGGQNLAGQLSANIRMMARGCVNCHSNIHGSNSPNGTFLTR